MLGSYFTNTGLGIGNAGEESTGPTVSNAMKMGAQGGGMMDGLFSGANFGTTMQGFGSLVGVVGSIFAQNKEAKYKDKLFKMEEKRIANEKKRQDKYDNGMSDAWS